MSKTKSLFTTILNTGLLVGTFDAIAAVIQYIIPTIRNPVRIFEYIASGVFGMDAFSGGAVMAVVAQKEHPEGGLRLRVGSCEIAQGKTSAQP